MSAPYLGYFAILEVKMMMYRKDSTADFIREMVKLSILSMPQFEIIIFIYWRPFKMIKRGKGKQRLSLLSLSELTFGARGVNSSAYVDAVLPLHFFSLSLATLNSGSSYLV